MKIEPTDIEPFSEPEEEYELPSYGTKGWVLVEVLEKIDTSYYPGWEWEINRSDYDCENSTFWLAEGIGIDYFINQYVCDDIPGPGIWMIEDVVGTYYRGDGWTTDDDEEWEWGNIRPAAQEEIDTL